MQEFGGQHEPGIEQQEESPHKTDVRFEQKEIKEDEPLTVEKAVKLFFLSYRFSQGFPTLQRMMFEYIKKRHPGWKIGEKLRGEIFERSLETFSNYMKAVAGRAHTEKAASGKALSEAMINNDLEQNLRWMAEAFYLRAKDIDKSSTLQFIARQIVERDVQFLSREKGRPRAQGAQGKSVHEDPFLSQVCYYGIEGHGTGSPEFDLIFQDVVEYLRAQKETEKKEGYLTDQNFLGKLDFVIAKYNAMHPGVEVSLGLPSEKEAG